ncbi:MAG: DNA translocase FtsK 4TM domain-containing protein [Coriobacteriia bacterium]|nr:DNA translocase FtsK 4TM domain-containing protein [Coriobacteriia bacterium]
MAEGKQKRKKLEEQKAQGIIDNKAKNDIIGVVFIVLGVALLAVSLIPTNAPVTSFLVNALKYVFGIGIYVFPLVLAGIGVSFFMHMARQKVTVRVSIGLSIIFIAILTLISLTSPAVVAERQQDLFQIESIVNFGGVIGAAIAWIGVTLLGPVVTAILMVGLIVTGLIVIGLSITKIVARLKQRRDDIERAQQTLEDRPKIKLFKKKDKQASIETKAIADVEDEIEFEPNQNETRKLVQEEPPKPKAEPKKTQVLKKPAVAQPKPQEGFELPSMDVLDSSVDVVEQSNSELKGTASKLQETLGEFGISAKVVGWVPGPTVTLFKVDLPAGIRVSRITALNDDIALALAAPGVRVFAPIPGTTYVGIEIPNSTRQTVILSEVLSKAKSGPLQLAIGKDVEGKAILSDLSRMPHLLIGGTTGSGKSVSINSMIMSILMRATPSEVRLILIDPKRVEFTPYNGIPHLYVPVVTEPKEAASALSWGVAEMENRLRIFSENGVRNIGGYNAKAQKSDDMEELPYIVIIIDELADLMMAMGKEVEFSISRIAQLARAAGIHLIVATQRPSTNVVTGLIKANITNRIAFNVASGIDSRVILDTGGAESLIGLGDLLFSKPEFSKPLRVQGCYVSEDEIKTVVEHLKKQGEPDYHNDILKTNVINVSDASASGTVGDDDALLWEAADMVVSAQHGSTSSLQRRFKIGYARAGRIMDMLEEKGIVGPQNGSKPREVLVDHSELDGIKALNDYESDE